MTDLLEEAFARATRLPDDEQDAFARRLMDELESERHWSRSFETSQRQLANLAREALAEDLVGRTEPLDPDRLTASRVHPQVRAVRLAHQGSHILTNTRRREVNSRLGSPEMAGFNTSAEATEGGGGPDRWGGCQCSAH